MNNTNDSATPQSAAPAPATPAPISRWIIPVPIKAGVSANGSNGNGNAGGNGNGHHPPEPPTAPAQPADLLTNYITNRLENGQTQRIALTLREITTRIYRLTDGWPRRVGPRLFVDLGHPRPLRWLDSVDDLFAWLHTIAPAPGLSWGISDDDFGTTLITQRQLFAHLTACAVAYDAAESLPYWPPVPTIYTSWPMPTEAEISAGVSDDANMAAKTLVAEFLGHFNPADPADEAILHGLFLTQFWGGPASERPMFVVTTADKSVGADSGGREQQAGKTQVVQRICSLGGYFEPRISKSVIGDELDKQIAGPIARSRRTFLLDNTEGILSDPRLASYVTAETYSGAAKWEKQAERPNLTSWVVTTNELSFSTDITTRVIVLRIKHPRQLDPSWKANLIGWIAERRTELINAAITILRRGPSVPINELRAAGLSRMPQWDCEVLACHPSAAAALKQRRADLPIIDTGCDEVDLFIGELFRRFEGRPPSVPITLGTAALTDAWNESTGLKYSTVWALRTIRKHAKRGRLPMLKLKHENKHASDWVLTLANFPKI